MHLSSQELCRSFLESEDAATIAQQILLDQAACQDQKLPSLLALYLPPSGSQTANDIATKLFPESKNYSRTIKMMQYSGMVQGIKAYLHQMTPHTSHEELPDSFGKFETSAPSNEEYETALKVLDFCTMNTTTHSGINWRTPLGDIVANIKHHLNGSALPTQSNTPLSRKELSRKPRKCYICQFHILTPHPQYPALCPPCGNFNLASSKISLPEALDLEGKTALVTGARINLGYHTALRLLRCGARVISTTRYPRDAEVRYLKEIDSAGWSKRLKVVGADFRAAADVFQLVSIVQEQVREWGGNLHILINNAAQTLTDSMEKENEAVNREQQLRLIRISGFTQLLLGEGYDARVRGGTKASTLLSQTDNEMFSLQEPDIDKANSQEATAINTTSAQDSSPLVKTHSTSKSSWMQSLHQIPYEDFISAHSVNTFVPLILIRELLPLMGSTKAGSEQPTLFTTKANPLAYIINVTSREGIFESNPDHASKNGKHVHTNLTKAALNMLTETEAAPAWKERRVAMNSVDPGYMSAAPEIEAQWKAGKGKLEMRGECPIGWEDGAGRVLWPIAIGEREGKAVWGRLLKHFGRVEVNVGAGR